MIAGALELQMSANLAQLSSDMAAAKRTVTDGADAMKKAAEGAVKALEAIGISLSVEKFAELVKGAVDAADSLNNLSKASFLSVEALSGLSFAAKLAGTDLQTMVGSIDKLAENMGKNADKFAALGISVKDPLEAFKQLSDVFVSIQDPQLRAAVGAEALGKGWKTAAPLLAMGGEEIGALVQKGQQLSGMTQDIADQSQKLIEKLETLKGNGGALNSLLSQSLPLMNATADSLVRISQGSTVLSAVWSGLTEVLRVIVILAGNVGFVLNAVGATIGGIGAQLAALAQGDFARFNDIQQKLIEDGQANRVAFDAWEKSILAVGAAAKSTTTALDAQDQVSRKQAQDAAATARAFLDFEARKKAAQDAVKQAAADAERLRKEGNAGWVAYAAAVFATADQLNTDMAKINDDFWKHEADLKKQGNADWVKYVEATKEEYEKGLKEIGDMQPSHIEAVQKSWNDAINYLDRGLRSAWDAFVEGGSGAAQRVRDALKRTLLDWIYEQFAKPIILNLIGNVAGLVGLSGLSGAASAAGANAAGSSIGGSLLSSAATSFGSTALGDSLAANYAGFTGAFSAGADVTGMGAMAGGTGISAIGAGTFGEAAGTFLAAIPVYGWIALAVIAVAAYFGGKGGGPKTGGYAGDSFDASGNLVSGGVAAPGTDNGRYFTPSQMDSQLKGVVDGFGKAYAATIAQLGGTASAFSFLLGEDNDPNGSAKSRVSEGVLDANGKPLYQSIDQEMDDKDVPAAIALALSRAVLVAVQNSKLPPALAAIMNAVDAASATQDQINAIYELAGAFQTLTSLTGTFSVGDVIAAASMTAMDSFTAQAAALKTLASQTTMSVDSLNALSAATQQYRAAAAQMIVDLENAKNQIASMFGDTAKNIQLAGLDNQGKYNFYQQDADSLLSRALGSTDAATITQLTSQINQDINSAFSLLSPEQQVAMQQQFLTRITDANTLLQTHLTDVQTTVADQANTTLGQIKDVMTDAATKFGAAADTVKQGGEDIQNAANTPLDVNVTVHNDGSSSVMVNGG